MANSVHAARSPTKHGGQRGSADANAAPATECIAPGPNVSQTHRRRPSRARRAREVALVARDGGVVAVADSEAGIPTWSFVPCEISKKRKKRFVFIYE